MSPDGRNEKVTVVVPVYNAEKYLHECVESLLKQTLREVEFIFVDDGSQDNSVSVLEDYKARDKRIKIFHQQNLFAGVARNNGFSHASGKYVIFLDSDDFFEPCMLEKAYLAAEQSGAQIVAFDFFEYDDVTKQVSEYKLLSNKYKGGLLKSETREKFITELKGVPWNKLILREFIENEHLEYQALRNTNDEFFNKMAVILADRIYYLKMPLVYYRKNNNQSLRGSREKDLTCGISCAVALRREIKKRGITASSAITICDNISKCVLYLALDTKFDYENAKSTYKFAKENLIHGLFENKEDYPKDAMLCNLLLSQTYEEYLFLENRRLNGIVKNQSERIGESVSKKSKAYKVGRAVMFIPGLLSKMQAKILLKLREGMAFFR